MFNSKEKTIPNSKDDVIEDPLLYPPSVINENGNEVSWKFDFYKSNNLNITFRLLNKQEYFFSGEIISCLENKRYKETIDFHNSFIMKLDSGELFMEYYENVDNLSIHPSSYQPIKYFERKPIDEKTREFIFQRDNNRCKLKLDGCTEVAEEIDHIIPVSKGGSNNIDNLQSSCKHCNLKKGSSII